MPLIEGPLIYRPEQKPGKAVLVVGAKGTFVLRPNDKLSLGDRWRGAQKYFVVDVSRKSSELAFLTPSNKSVLEFEVQATIYCRVANPVQAFLENLTDPGAAMHATVKKVVAGVANETDITEAIKLKSRLEAYFHDHRVTNAPRRGAEDEASAELLEIDLKVFPAESAREYVGNIEREDLAIRSSQALHRIQDSQRKAMDDAFWSHEELLKQWIAVSARTGRRRQPAQARAAETSPGERRARRTRIARARAAAGAGPDRPDAAGGAAALATAVVRRRSFAEAGVGSERELSGGEFVASIAAGRGDRRQGVVATLRGVAGVGGRRSARRRGLHDAHISGDRGGEVG